MTRGAITPFNDVAIVAHGGAIETKAAVLAASLRHRQGPSLAITIAVPEPASLWQPLSPAARAVFEELGAQIVAIENPIGADYPHGNKLAAMASIERACAFLDSDMIMLRGFKAHWSLQRCDVAAKRADIDTFQSSGGDWRRVYALFELPVPGERVLSTVAQEIMVPYYNSGFIWARNGARLSKTWIDTARAIEASGTIANTRPWLDQIALPLAFARLGWTVSPVPDALNFPAHLSPMPERAPYLAHYHSTRNFAAFAAARSVLRELRDASPTLAHLIDHDTEWQRIG